MIYPLFKLLRPRQWLKNALLFFPPFLAGSIGNKQVIAEGILPFIAFSLVSSAMYILNDYLDRERDRLHPVKSRRPIASGKVSPLMALAAVTLTGLGGFAVAAVVSNVMAGILLIYCGINVGYSCYLKNVPLFDLFCISSGFLLRLMAGGHVFSVKISEWLFLSVFLLALYLSTGKRLGEKASLGIDASSHRQSLHGYPEGVLEGIMYVTGAAVLVTYSMYAIQKGLLIYTVPLCTFGILRYLLRVKAGGQGDPTEALLKDPVLFSVGLLWALAVTCFLYL